MTWAEGSFESPLLGNSCLVSKLCYLDLIQEVLMSDGNYCNFHFIKVCRLSQSSAAVQSKAVWVIVSQVSVGVLSRASFLSEAQVRCNHSPVG